MFLKKLYHIGENLSRISGRIFVRRVVCEMTGIYIQGAFLSMPFRIDIKTTIDIIVKKSKFLLKSKTQCAII